MISGNQSVRVAVIQAASIFMDRDATLEKAIRLIKQAGEKGARIVVFPEAFIPAYPRGLSFGTIIGSRTDDGRKDWYRYWENSIPVPGEATELLGEAAREAGVYLIIGVIERDSEYSGGIFIAPCYFSVRMGYCLVNIAN